MHSKPDEQNTLCGIGINYSLNLSLATRDSITTVNMVLSFEFFSIKWSFSSFAWPTLKGCFNVKRNDEPKSSV